MRGGEEAEIFNKKKFKKRMDEPENLGDHKETVFSVHNRAGGYMKSVIVKAPTNHVQAHITQISVWRQEFIMKFCSCLKTITPERG